MCAAPHPWTSLSLREESSVFAHLAQRSSSSDTRTRAKRALGAFGQNMESHGRAIGRPLCRKAYPIRERKYNRNTRSEYPPLPLQQLAYQPSYTPSALMESRIAMPCQSPSGARQVSSNLACAFRVPYRRQIQNTRFDNPSPRLSRPALTGNLYQRSKVVLKGQRFQRTREEDYPLPS